MTSLDRVVSVAERVGSIADGIQAKLRWFVLIAGMASSLLAIMAFNIDGSWWWNAIKVGLLLLPSLIWLLILLVLNQLKQAPELVSELVNDDNGVFENMDSFSLKEPDGLRGLFSTVKAFRQEDGFDTVFDTIGGIGLIVNPFFALLAFISIVILFLFILFLFILIAPFVLLF